MELEDHVAVTYTLIYHFLKKQSKDKVAEALRKAARPIAALRDDIKLKGPPLEDIVKEWRAKNKTKIVAESSSEDSESSDDSSSDEEGSTDSDASSEDTSGSGSEGDGDTSDSDDTSDDSEEETEARKSPQKGAERDTSVTLSSAEENVREVAKQIVEIPQKKSTKDKDKGSESDSSDSDDSDSSSSSKKSASETSSGTSDSSSSPESSDEDEVDEDKKTPPNATKTMEDKVSSSSESSSDSEDESDSEPQPKVDVHVAKKRKTSENGGAVATAVSTKLQRNTSVSQKGEKPPPKIKERFQRVKVQDMAPEQLLDNGYKARGGATNDYGERAHRDLVVTRGAGFRKEKNKKKRGSYRGGEITMENHSIKFNF